MQETQETHIGSLGREDPLEEEWQPAPMFLPGESQGQRSLAGYGPWGCKRVRHDLETKQEDIIIAMIFQKRKLSAFKMEFRKTLLRCPSFKSQAPLVPELIASQQ